MSSKEGNESETRLIRGYGDTDSFIVSVPSIKDVKDYNYWGIRLSEEISGIKPGETDCDGITWPEGRPGLFPPPIEMKYDKVMRQLHL